MKTKFIPYFLFLFLGLSDVITTLIGINYFGLIEGNSNAVFMLNSISCCVIFYIQNRFLFPKIKNSKQTKNIIIIIYSCFLLIPIIWNTSLIIFSVS